MSVTQNGFNGRSELLHARIEVSRSTRFLTMNYRICGLDMSSYINGTGGNIFWGNAARSSR
eukprot:scaffold264158_cov33-Prasinocladus_malaysianus.AAC.1